MNADNDDDMIAVLWCRQQQRRRRAHLNRIRAALCAVQLHRLIFTPLLCVAEPRNYPTRFPRIDLSLLDDADCLLRFRFTPPEIERICAAMDLPEYIVVNRVRSTRAFAMAVLLRHLVWPTRLVDHATEFGLDSSSLGRIINEMATMLISLYAGHLDLWPGVTPAHVARCAAAVTAYSPPAIDIWGFIDGTARRIARPVLNQRPQYSGYKRAHLYQYQGVVTPDGLIVSCMGPFVGSKNDLNMLVETGLERRLEPLVKQAGRTLLLYADLIYGGHPLVMRGFDAAVTEQELMYNKFMSSLRVHVETGFGKVTQLFSGTDLKRVQRGGLSPIAAYYLCAVLFANIHTCMHPEHSNVPWLLDPPTVEEYLQ